MGYIKYSSEAAYSAATKPTDGSQVALVESTNDVKVDGVNVFTTEPTTGDIVFYRLIAQPYGSTQAATSEILYMKGGSNIVPSSLSSELRHVGYVVGRFGRKVLIIDKDSTSTKYADVVQFQVTVPSETTTMSLGARFVSADSNTTISVEYTEGMDLATTANTYEANDTTLCGRINTALAAVEGITGDWWAYLDSDNRVILQRDTWTDYRQYICSGALTHITWGDMPANSNYFKSNGKQTEYRGLMNFDRGETYWSTNGRTPDSAESLGTSGGTSPVTSAAFTSSEYCTALRAAYSTYRDYLKGEFGIIYPQQYGTFSLGGGKALCDKYATEQAPTKSGSTKYKYPAMAYCANKSYNVPGLSTGDIFLPGSLEGCYIMDDDTLTKLAASMAKMGTTVINNSSYRWFAERYGVYGARNFFGNLGYLSSGYVYYTFLSEGVALLDL